MKIGPKKVLIFPEEGGWIAQCLEHDIVAQGENVREAKERLILTVVCQAVVDLKNGKAPLEGIDRAPQRYWDQFEEGHRFEWDKNEFRPDLPSLPELPEDISFPEDISLPEDMRLYA